MLYHARCLFFEGILKTTQDAKASGTSLLWPDNMSWSQANQLQACVMTHFLLSALKNQSPQLTGKSAEQKIFLSALIVASLTVALLYGQGVGLFSAVVFVLMVIFSLSGVIFFLGLHSGIIQFEESQEQANFISSYLEGLPYGVILTNDDGHITFANSNYMTLTGSTRVRIPTVTNLFGREVGASSAVYRLGRAVKRGEDWSEEFRVEPRRRPENPLQDGGWYRCQTRKVSFPGREPGQEESYTLWEIIEITKERLRLEKTYQSMQNIIDNLTHAPAGFFVTTPSGRISYINDTLSDWLGLDNRENLTNGLMMTDLFWGEDEALLTFPGKQACQEGQSPCVQEIDLDLAHLYGKRVAVRLYSEPVYDIVSGDFTHRRTLVMRRDTKRNQQSELQILQTKYNRLFLTSPVPVATIDKVGNILSANALFMRLFDDGEHRVVLAQTNMKDIVNKSAKSRLMKAVGLLENDQSSEIDVTFGSGDTGFHHSEQRDGKLFLSPLERSDRDEEAALVFAMDLTEQRTMEMQMAQGHKMAALGQFAGGIAHDFNNVLQAIIGFSELLLQDHTPKDPAFKDIISIKNNATRAAGLVRQILAFSRGQTLRATVFSLNDVLPDLDNVLRLNEKVHREVHLGRDLWSVKADRTQFEQVVLNLAKNAMDAMPEGGNITIRTSNITMDDTEAAEMVGMQSGQYVLCEVSDTGTGIAPEILAKIFEPFFTTKDMGKGTGLGLSSVYGIIKQSEGFIYPESVLGEGTTFRIYLPRHIASSSDLAAKEEKPQLAKVKKEGGDTGNEVILLVEDEESVRAFSARALTSRGYKVLEAEDGEEALEVYEEVNGKIDLLISDVMMPVMDGPTLLGELRQINPELKAILMSGYAEDSTRKQMDGEQEFVFLNKPFQLKQLISTIKDALNG